MPDQPCGRKRGDAIITDLIQLVYASQPFGYDDATLKGILVNARRCNLRDDITGALVCRRDIYLQMLEGPAAQIEATYERIKRDDRHIGVRKLVSAPVRSRIFGDWAMLHDPAKSWIWPEAELDDGALDRASEGEVVTLFEDLARKAKEAP